MSKDIRYKFYANGTGKEALDNTLSCACPKTQTLTGTLE
jgi:hypothetical protein